MASTSLRRVVSSHASTVFRARPLVGANRLRLTEAKNIFSLRLFVHSQKFRQAARHSSQPRICFPRAAIS